MPLARKVSEYRSFIMESVRQVRERWRTHGRRSGLALARCIWSNLYIRQRTKLMRRPRVECPICGWKGFDFGMIDCGTFTVPHVECPQCKSHERHRMLHLYLTRKEPEFFCREAFVLHFAPEPHVRDLIDRNPRLKCVSTDYAWHMVKRYPDAAFQADMQHMPVTSESVDIVFCLHVLEHVPDDRQGVAEMSRTLKPGGVAYIMVPFMMGWKETVEFGAPDPAIYDHVRGYAPSDFKNRLETLACDEVFPLDFMTRDEVRRFRIPTDSQIIYRCVKP